MIGSLLVYIVDATFTGPSVLANFSITSGAIKGCKEGGLEASENILGKRR